MKKKSFNSVVIVGIIIIILLLLLFNGIKFNFDINKKSGINNGELILVAKNGRDYYRIQDAIDNATNGDTIQVDSGIYYENIIINKSISLIGSDRATTIINGGNNGIVVLITANDITFKSFTIENNGSYYSGIKLDGRHSDKISGCVISENRFTNNSIGIFLENVKDNYLMNNIITSNNNGIHLESSSSNFLLNNTIKMNKHNGINLDSSYVNKLEFNTITSNGRHGIYLSFSSSNTIINNTITSNNYGIYLDSSSLNSMLDNTVTSSEIDGISLVSSSNNKLSNNLVNSNGHIGISLKLISDTSLDYNSKTRSEGSGKSYYVSTIGNDTNDGLTEVTAWRTINYACSHDAGVVGGDTVWIKSGDYGSEFVVVRRSGTPGKYITFQGYNKTPGDTPEIDEMPIINGTNGKEQGFNIFGVSYIKWKYFSITQCLCGIWAYGCKHLIFENIEITKSGIWYSDGQSFVIQKSEYCMVKNCTLIDATATAMGIYGSHHNILDNCTVLNEDYGTGNGMDYYILITGSHDNIIRNCKIQNFHYDGIHHSGHGFGIKDAWNGTGYPKNSYNNKIINCVATNLGEAFFVAHEAHHNVFMNCTAHHQTGPKGGTYPSSFHVRDGAHNNKFINCISNNTLVGILIADSVEGRDGIRGAQTESNNLFKNIVIKVSDYPGNRYTKATAIAFSSGARDNIFDGMTIVGTSSNDDYLLTISDTNYDNIMRNCIITNLEHKEFDMGGTGSLNITYSCFYHNGFNIPNNIGNIEADPLFADEDYHLKSEYGRRNGVTWVKDGETSPCIDKGAPSDNYCREPQPNGGRINMGAYGHTVKASKSSSNGKYGFIEGSYNNLLTGNTINDNLCGIYLKSSTENKIIGTTITTKRQNAIGIHLSVSSDNNKLEGNNIKTSGTASRGILITDSAKNDILSSELTIEGLNSYGFYLDGLSATIKNSLISTSQETKTYDIYSGNNGYITSINCSFKSVRLTENNGGVLQVKNYLTIQIYQGNANTPLSGVDVEVKNDNQQIYVSSGYGGTKPSTDTNGRVEYILVTDKIYNRNNTPIKYKTNVKVKKFIDGSTWEETRPNINMEMPHTEIFNFS